MVKKLLIRIWLLIELGIKSWFKYTFRKRNMFMAPLILVTTQLMSELGELASSDYLDPLYKFITEEYGKLTGVIVEVLGDFITGNYLTGFSYLSIIIKFCLIILFSFFAFHKEKGIKITWIWFWGWKWNWHFFSNNKVALINKGAEFKVTDDWFKEINSTYRLNKNKFIKDLHIESNLEKKLFDLIVNEKTLVDEYMESVNSCRNASIRLKTELNELNLLIEDNRNPLIISDKSSLYDDYINIAKTISELNEELSKISDLGKVRSNRQVEIERIYFPISMSELSDYINSYSFDLIKVKTKLRIKDKFSIRRRIFNAFLPVLIAVRNLNEIVDELNKRKANILRNHYIIHASAGIGKTYFAAHIYNSLKVEEHYPLFIPGSAFSGNHSNLQLAFQKVFKYSDGTSLSKFFLKLNEFAKKKDKRIILIIDGLNETTYDLSGFSSIWEEGIENLTDDISKYEYLTFLATCRTSYLENNIDPTFSLEGSYKLKGFEDFEIRKNAIEQYFNYYRIGCSNINNRNSRLFITPLILKIYCMGKNGDRLRDLNVELNHNSYEETLFRFVDAECIDIAKKLDRPSSQAIYNGINRSSEKFIYEISGSLDYDKFLESVQGKNIDEIFKSTSIGCKFLDSELIFMKDIQPYFEGEKVVHTFQNVGGYLLAQYIYFNNSDPSNFVKSEEFTKSFSGAKKDRMYGKLNENCHQLALDIMLFMVYKYSKNDSQEYSNDLIDYTNDPLVFEYSWRFVQDYWGSNASARLEKKLRALCENFNLWDGLFEISFDEYIDVDNPLNFEYIKTFLLQIQPLYIDLIWGKNIYENIGRFRDFLGIDYSEYSEDKMKIAIDITIWLLESTSHNLRDLATKKLLEYGSNNPNFIISKIEEYAKSGRLYIYERLAGIAYGICLRNQNNQTFIKNELRKYAEIVYKMQFSDNPTAFSYHYIIIDCFKHIIDLAVYLEVFEIPEKDRVRLREYKFFYSEDWQNITEEDKNRVSLQWKGYPDPDPLSGDFVTYTIPRLLKNNKNGHVDAVAHIYKRLLINGYKPVEDLDFLSGVEKDFYTGVRRYGIGGKIDRVGKKYSWTAFFEYAGYLLNIGELGVFYDGDSSVTSFYDRLSDVELEVSNPSKSVERAKLYSTQLLAEKIDSPKWTYIEKFDSLNEVFSQQFESKKFTLLYGYYVESEKSEHSFSVRSFLLIEPFLVKREDVYGKEDQIMNRTIGWEYDLHSGGAINKTYFGELYWADTIPDMKQEWESVPSNEMQEVDNSIMAEDLSLIEMFHAKKMKKKGKEIIPVQIPLTVEPAIVDYSWESNSEIYNSLRCNIPSPNIGKHLKLKADPISFQILDENNKRAFLSVEYGDNETLKQESDYIRTDLLQKYLQDKGLVLMYQIKQHTFDRNAGDGSGDFRGMQFKLQDVKI